MKRYNLCAVISLLALTSFCLAWELWLAPLHPGGSTLALKAVPLLLPLFGLLHEKRYTHQWVSLFSLLYLGEGLVRIAPMLPRLGAPTPFVHRHDSPDAIFPLFDVEVSAFAGGHGLRHLRGRGTPARQLLKPRHVHILRNAGESDVEP